MARTCTVCNHKDVQEIDKLLLSNEAYRNIAKQFGISESAVFRHKANHLITALADVHAAMVNAREIALSETHNHALEEAKAEAVNGVVSRLDTAEDILMEITAQHAEAVRLRDQASEDGDIKTALLGIDKCLKSLELVAKIQHMIQDQNINIIQQNVLINHPEWIALKSKLIGILRKYPAIMQEVKDALS